MPGDVVLLSEVFGPTIQGEGRHAGRPCAFCRLALCNLDCKWCDTPYTWDWQRYDRDVEVHHVSVGSAVEQVRACLGGADLVVVSGGEPLVQRRALVELAAQLRPLDVHVETNGTVAPGDDLTVAWFSVSPKLLPSSQVDLRRAYKQTALAALAERPGAIKLVVDPVIDTPRHVDAAIQMCELAGWEHDRIDLMAEGASPERLAENTGDVRALCERFTVGFSPRLHVSELGGGRGI